MRFQNVINALFTEPWAITGAGWDKAFNVAKPHLTGQLPAIPKAEDDSDIYGDPMPKMEVRGNLAIIPIKGTLIQHAGLLEKMCGACSYDDIKADIKSALDMSGRIEVILFDISSPGGMCVGNQEVCDLVMEAREELQCYAFTDSEMCSAAYNIAASCDAIFCTKSAFAGSIGTLMAILDRTEAFKQAGLKVELFASGKFKGAGTPGTELTDEQRDYFAGLRDDFAEMFKDNVRANRGDKIDADESAMEGQAFVGQSAVAAGLVDKIVDDIEDAIDEIS